jgi:hypothetical protein
LILPPGASRDKKSALFANEDTSFSFVMLPTLTALLMQAGMPMAFVTELLPLEITVAMPAARRLSMIGLRLSLSQGDVSAPAPMLMLTEAIA